jgi:hypothetical protein
MASQHLTDGDRLKAMEGWIKRFDDLAMQSRFGQGVRIEVMFKLMLDAMVLVRDDLASRVLPTTKETES